MAINTPVFHKVDDIRALRFNTGEYIQADLERMYICLEEPSQNSQTIKRFRQIKDIYTMKTRMDRFNGHFGVGITVNLDHHNNMSEISTVPGQPELRIGVLSGPTGLQYKQRRGQYLGDGVANKFDETTIWITPTETFRTECTSWFQMPLAYNPNDPAHELTDVQPYEANLSFDKILFPLTIGIQLNSYYNPWYIANGAGTNVPHPGFPWQYSPLTCTVRSTGNRMFKPSYLRTRIPLDEVFYMFRASTQGNPNVMPTSEQVINHNENTTTLFLKIATLNIDVATDTMSMSVGDYSMFLIPD